MLLKFINKLLQGQNLTQEESNEAFKQIMQGADNYQVTALLVLLAKSDETAAVLAGAISALQDSMIKIPHLSDCLDFVGTGGNSYNTTNISTASAILAAACGVKVCKHGNRAVTSSCGSADVLQALGIEIHMKADEVAKCIRKIGIGYCYAPIFHPAWSAVKEVRKALKIRTVFNYVGPLVNPAFAAYTQVGVFSSKMLPVFAKTLQRLPHIRRAMVVHSHGLDELTTIGESQVLEVTPAGLSYIEINPKKYGLAYCNLSDLAGGDVEYNKNSMLEAFHEHKGAIADNIILNTATGLYICEKSHSIKEGVEIARETLKMGKALETVKKWAKFSDTIRTKRTKIK